MAVGSKVQKLSKLLKVIYFSVIKKKKKTNEAFKNY